MINDLKLGISIVLAISLCGCDSENHRSDATEAESVVLALDAIKALHQNDTNLLEHCIMASSFDPNLRVYIRRLLRQQDNLKAVALLNQHIDLWIVGKIADSRPNPFPDNNDGVDIVSLVRNIAAHRREYPWVPTGELVRTTIQGALDHAQNLPNANRK